MKKDTHPTYYNDCIVTCVCGNTFKTGSTKKSIKVEVCAACHPFFTGEQKFVDTEGRVDKFIRKRKEAETTAATVKAKKDAKKKRQQEEKDQVQPKSLKDLLEKKETPAQKPKSEDKPKQKPSPETTPSEKEKAEDAQ